MRKINLFICYAKEDGSYLETLKAYINEKQFSKMQIWYDGLIDPGNDWGEAIHDKLNKADIILLLLSQYFLISDYINKVELKAALKRHDAGLSRVIPIFARKCNLDHYPAITRLQGLPEGMRFFSEMGNDVDTHYAILQKKIETIADELTLEKDLAVAIDNNNNKAGVAREIVQLRNRNRIFLSIPAGAEGKKRRREFLYQVEGRIKYESWPFEITPGLSEDTDEAQLASNLKGQLKDCLYSILVVAEKDELSEGAGKLYYDLACRQDQQSPFHRKIIWYLNAGVRDAMDPELARQLATSPNIIGCDYESIFEKIRSLEVERERQLLQLKKSFATTMNVLMLYNFNTDHNSDLRIRLKTKLEEYQTLSFRFNLPNDNLQKEKEDLDICHGALIFYGSADPQWYLMRQSLLLNAQHIRSKAVCVDEPELDVKIRRDVIKSAFITIKGATELDEGLDNFLNGLNTQP